MKRLKIVEQIIIVLILAILIPFTTIGIIISNISQQSVRSELENNASLIAHFAGDSIENYISLSQEELSQTAKAISHIPQTMSKLQYFNEVESQTDVFKSLSIVEKNKLPKEKYSIKDGNVILYAPIDGIYYLCGLVNIDISDTILKKSNTKGRNIYVFDFKTKELVATNSKDSIPLDILSDLKPENDLGIFGNRKNTPKAYYKLNNPDWIVVVDTTKKITAKTITKARYRIILSLCIAALSTIIIVGLYTYYLYINIRQLFKGITAISKGNYDKKIHLIKRIFTPHEIVFLAKEFNYMANKVNVSHKDLKKKNKELQNLNEFRENLINATSHEFRTPLTSIIGYTSRLLRHDITLDDETRIKSLQIIKQQAQRLSRMVEDLLVIPELESYSLKFNIQEVPLDETLNRVLEYLDTKDAIFNTSISQDLKYVWADEYRLEQIFINLIDNAIKYNIDNQPIKIEAKNENEVPVVKITNKCERISEKIKTKLFEKFIRVDSKLTRTTRGTGLGLYIVQGLAQAMKIDIELISNDEFTIVLRFNDYVK